MTGLWPPAFIATWLFDPLMSALLIIQKQNSDSVIFFLNQKETWVGFAPLWDRLVSPYWWPVSIVILLSMGGTADSDIWYIFSFDRTMEQSHHLWDYAWTPEGRSPSRHGDFTVWPPFSVGKDRLWPSSRIPDTGFMLGVSLPVREIHLAQWWPKIVCRRLMCQVVVLGRAATTLQSIETQPFYWMICAC